MNFDKQSDIMLAHTRKVSNTRNCKLADLMGPNKMQATNMTKFAPFVPIMQMFTAYDGMYKPASRIRPMPQFVKFASLRAAHTRDTQKKQNAA